jgi:hypothetical protein
VTHYGTLRTWSAVFRIVGTLAIILAIPGWIIWAIEVEGTLATLAVIILGLPLLIFFATWPIAIGQAMRAIADIGDAVRAPDRID